jgi:FKBP-type peptidyl-prolyl cis-trans isomerase SlyD
MRIEQNSAVLVHYHLTSSDGEVIDSSNGKDPLSYLHGHNNLVPGVERALEGQEAGAKIDVEVSPADGYGEHDPSLDVLVPLSAFPSDMSSNLKPGAMFQGPHPSDETRTAMYTVIELAGNEVRCSANHPLAGVTLHFNLEVMEIREATEAELSQGRPLPPGGIQQSGCCSDPSCDK